MKQEFCQLMSKTVAWFSHSGKNVECFKKSFTTLKAYVNLFRRHVQRLKLS
jgi:hypothetical protein